MSRTDERLKELGIELPPSPKPMAHYVPYRVVGDMVFVAGQGPLIQGQVFHPGVVGDNLSLEEAKDAARISALNVLSVLKDAAGGDLDKIELVRMLGFVRSTNDFMAQPKVIDGASDLFCEVLGDRGLHSRVALGTNVLPFDTCVEIEVIARIIK